MSVPLPDSTPMTMPASARAQLTWIVPFFVVRDIAPAVAFYRDRLGFDLTFLGPTDGPYFAIVERDHIGIMLKAVHPDVPPMPNPSRHPWARWDAYVHTADPDALAEEFVSRGVILHTPVDDNEDRLRGFEIQDVDGYVIFFGHPL
jgi:catechol 2,3-dioxygenase-like lactoylglutathione lyase family enzyme